MKRINWESSVKKWESIEQALINFDLHDASYWMDARCGYCIEFQPNKTDNPCRDCPLNARKLCYYWRRYYPDRIFWRFNGMMTSYGSGKIPNTYGNRHKALMLCREILQGIYADMHDLED